MNKQQMKNFTVLLFFFSIFEYAFCQVQDTIFYDADWEETSKVDAEYYRLRNVDSSNGCVKVKDCLLSGEVQMEGQYLSSKMETEAGGFIWYYKNGKSKSYKFYKEGKKEGDSKDWYENGNLECVGAFADDKKNGKWMYYFKDKKVSAQIVYENGEKISQQYWNENGTVLTDTASANLLPAYPGGDNALRSDIQTNIQYPEEAQLNGIQGRVYVSIIVDKDGVMKDVRVVRSVMPCLDNEALRVVKLLKKKWIPGKSFNRPFDFSFTLPINFELTR